MCWSRSMLVGVFAVIFLAVAVTPSANELLSRPSHHRAADHPEAGAEGTRGEGTGPGAVNGFLVATLDDEGVVEDSTGPLDMLVILDRSGSMSGLNWDGAVSGLTEYLYDSSSTGTSFGLNFFPVQGAADQCDPTLYDPPQVALGELPGHASFVLNELAAQTPSGATTPTHPALEGSLIFATAHQINNPDHVVIVVLVTDGWPTECDTSIPNIAALALSAFNSFGVRTYVVGLPGAPASALDLIAASGGTDAAYILADASLLGGILSEIQVDALGPEIFSDGFESGDTSAWSVTVS